MTPDVPPNSGRLPITWVPYSYTTPAQDTVTHRLVRGLQYRCYVHVGGRRFCVRLDQPGVAL